MVISDQSFWQLSIYKFSARRYSYGHKSKDGYSGDYEETPERALAAAVICRAFTDATKFPFKLASKSPKQKTLNDSELRAAWDAYEWFRDRSATSGLSHWASFLNISLEKLEDIRCEAIKRFEIRMAEYERIQGSRPH